MLTIRVEVNHNNKPYIADTPQNLAATKPQHKIQLIWFYSKILEIFTPYNTKQGYH